MVITEKVVPTIAPRFQCAQKDGAKANIWEMGRVVHEDIAAIPLSESERNEKTVIAVIVLDLSKVRLLYSVIQLKTIIGAISIHCLYKNI